MNLTVTNHREDMVCSSINDGFTLLELSRGWLSQGNPVVGMELLKSAIISPEADRDKQLRAQILKETGRTYMMSSDWENANAHYLEAQRIFTDAQDYKGASECARNRANMFFQQGNYSMAEQLCNSALDFASDLNDRSLRASILNTLGAIKSATGDHTEAIKIHKLCLSDFESIGNKIRQGYVLLNIGLTYHEIHEFINAVDNLNKALAIALEQKDLNLVEICYQNIAKNYLAQGEIHLAKSVIDIARKILPGLNSKALEAELSLIEIKILRQSGNIKDAEILLEKTYRLTINHKLTAIEADILYEQGLLEKSKGNLPLAITKLDAAVNLYKKLDIEQGVKKAVHALENLNRRSHV